MDRGGLGHSLREVAICLLMIEGGSVGREDLAFCGVHGILLMGVMLPFLWSDGMVLSHQRRRLGTGWCAVLYF